MNTILKNCLDTLAYLIDVGGRPIPYIFAGLVGGWLTVSLELIEDDAAAVAVTVLLAVSVALMFLPPFLWVNRWAKAHRSAPFCEGVSIRATSANGPLQF